MSAEVSTAGVPTAGQVAGRRWRASRGVVFALLALVALAVAIAAMQPSVERQYLDPESPSQGGSRALAQILQQRGTPVRTVRTAEAAVERAAAGTLLVIVRSERLTVEELDGLRRTPANLLLVEPSRPTLEALAPQVQPATGTFERVASPGCELDAAVRAGSVYFGLSEVYLAPGEATRCYLSDGMPRLVQVPVGPRTVTVLGTGTPLTNERLDDEGNAALAMNLMDSGPGVVWLIPDLPEPGSTSAQSWEDLVPPGVWLFVLQVFVAVVLVALWRMRRMGPVVAEALPVVVRSAETVEGRSRLYRAHRARGRAADALRAGARDRLVPLLGLPRGA
ncbi:MAG TPA: DUF4350 domain-containing protein, partial [Thermomonospora sp.]|nr:DUF4350 domain-containing protein [Thermomonospora sp.]